MLRTLPCTPATPWRAQTLVAWTLPATFLLTGCGREADSHPIGRDLADLAQQVQATLPASRQLFLGDRRRVDRSCVRQIRAGSLQNGASPPRIKIRNGGCASFYLLPKASDPLRHFEALQSTLRSQVSQRLQRCRAGTKQATAMAARARDLRATLERLEVVPEALQSLRIPPKAKEPSRPAACLRALVTALRNGKLATAKTWGRELEGACFQLADLHRWLQLLDENLLTALDFQARCREHFVATAASSTRGDPYLPGSNLGRFAAGSLVLYGERNLYEVERQAEGLFGLDTKEPVDHFRQVTVPAAYHLPPRLRPAFLHVRGKLRPSSRAAFDRTAESPYDRSFLHGTLFRLRAAGALDDAVSALQRLEQHRATPTPSEVLDVLSHRGGVLFCGLEWGDRFDGRLTAISNGLRGDETARLAAASQFTANQFDPRQYRGGTTTLRAALDTRTFDCIRGTDMVGAIYRNTGGTRFVELRICRIRPPSHTIAGVLLSDRRVLATDGLEQHDRRMQTWPDAFFQEANDYCVEVYGRGLVSGVWLGGYIVQGPHAGTRFDAAIPYLPGAGTASVRRVFHGPFPGRRRMQPR